MSDIFYDCSHLKTINMSNFNFGKADIGHSYNGVVFGPLQRILERINLSGANFSADNLQSRSFEGLFYGFNALKSIDLSNANTSKVNDMQDMFSVVQI